MKRTPGEKRITKVAVNASGDRSTVSEYKVGDRKQTQKTTVKNQAPKHQVRYVKFWDRVKAFFNFRKGPIKIVECCPKCRHPVGYDVSGYTVDVDGAQVYLAHIQTMSCVKCGWSNLGPMLKIAIDRWIIKNHKKDLPNQFGNNKKEEHEQGNEENK